jgi:putative ATP-binding cassette transporter
MNLISFLLRQSKGTALLVVLTGFLSGLGYLGLPILLSVQLRLEAPVPWLAWSYVVLCSGGVLFHVWSEILLRDLNLQTIVNLSTGLSRQILAVPLKQLEEMGPSRLHGVLTEDIYKATDALGAVPSLGIQLIVLAGSFVYLGWLSPPVALGVVACTAVVAVAYRSLFMNLGRRRLQLARQEINNLMRHYRGLSDGIKELKLHRPRREAFLGRILTSAELIRGHVTRASHFHLVFVVGSQFLLFGFMGLLVFVQPSWQRAGAEVLSSALLLFMFLLQPMRIIIQLLPTFIRGQVALENIEDLGLLLKAQGTEKTAAPPAAGPDWESLELAGITYRFPRGKGGRDFCLGPIDLTLRRGELLFLVGDNGSGKTTLAKMLTGLYVPDGGEIRLDGRPVTDANREAYRQLFTAVFADCYLFDSLIGLDGPAADAAAGHLLALLQLQHAVRITDGVLSTLDLSHGQRKRLVLLTAFLEDRPVYVFDEWASDQDPMFRKVFYNQLLPGLKAKGKTVVVISHDDRFFHVADRVIHLQQGQIQQGTEIDDEPARATRHLAAVPQP